MGLDNWTWHLVLTPSFHIEGINQCQVNSEQGQDHANTHTSLLDTDHSVIMVSELPNLATANAAIKAVQKGNLILASLETNSALESLMHLREPGVSANHLVDSINLIVAQRLARRLCTNCRVAVEITSERLIEDGFSETELEGPMQVYSPGGCDSCLDGYQGKIGLFEVIKITGKVSETILADAGANEIAEACRRQDFPNIVQSGLKRVFEGVTSQEELWRVTGR